MRVNFDIHPAAQAEFFDTLRHYAALDEQDQAQPLAAAFDTAFNLHLSLILDNPLLYNLRRPPIRRANLTPRFGEKLHRLHGLAGTSGGSRRCPCQTPPLLLAQPHR